MRTDSSPFWKQSWGLQVTPSMPYRYSIYFFGIKGTWQNVAKHTETVNSRQLTATFSIWFSVLSLFFIINIRTIHTQSGSALISKYYHPVGTGPFKQHLINTVYQMLSKHQFLIVSVNTKQTCLNSTVVYTAQFIKGILTTLKQHSLRQHYQKSPFLIN